jgi:hypothetical protein
LNVGSVDAGAGQRRFGGNRTKLRGVEILERSSKTANRRPRSPENNYVTHGHGVPIISNDRSN